FLAVRGRAAAVATGYSSMLVLVALLAWLAPEIGLLGLFRVALLAAYALALGCVLYCRRLGFVDRRIGAQLLFLSFPPLFGVTLWLAGLPGVAIVTAVFLVAWLRLHGDDLRRLLAHATTRPRSISEGASQRHG